MQEANNHICSKCATEISIHTKFCGVCGLAQNHKEIDFQYRKKGHLVQLAVFFSLEMLVCLTAMLIETPTIGISLFLDLCMAIIAVFFFSINWQENKYLLKWPKFSLKKLILLISAAILSSLVIQFLVGQLNRTLFNEEFSSYGIYAFHKYGNYIMIASVALLPAIFEELAYRGFLMQKLLNIVEKKEAVYISALLFFFIHFSIISFFWMLPFALLLAHVRLKENTLWYGVMIHFFFNLVACIVEIYSFGDYFNF